MLKRCVGRARRFARLTPRTTVAIVAAAALLSACGSYTRQDFLQRARGICDSTLRELRLLPQPQLAGAASARLASLSAYLGRALPLVDDELHRLSALRRPTQTAAQARALNRYLDALHDSVDELGALARAARSGNPVQVAADESALAGDKLSALAVAGGLGACSVSSARAPGLPRS